MKNWYDSSQMWQLVPFFTIVKNRYQLLTQSKSSHLWKICIKSSHVKILYQNSHMWRTGTTSKLVPNFRRCDELVRNRHRRQWQNYEEFGSNAKWSRLGAVMWGIRKYAKWNLTSCVFCTKCEILVRNMWCISTKFFTCREKLVPIIHTVKFTRCEFCGCVCTGSSEHSLLAFMRSVKSGSRFFFVGSPTWQKFWQRFISPRLKIAYSKGN